MFPSLTPFFSQKSLLWNCKNRNQQRDLHSWSSPPALSYSDLADNYTSSFLIATFMPRNVKWYARPSRKNSKEVAKSALSCVHHIDLQVLLFCSWIVSQWIHQNKWTVCSIPSVTSSWITLELSNISAVIWDPEVMDNELFCKHKHNGRVVMHRVHSELVNCTPTSPETIQYVYFSVCTSGKMCHMLLSTTFCWDPTEFPPAKLWMSLLGKISNSSSAPLSLEQVANSNWMKTN